MCALSTTVAAPALAQRPVPAVEMRGHGVADELLRFLEDAARDMAPFPSLPIDSPLVVDRAPVTVEVAGSEDELTRLSGGGLPEWGAGFAFPATRTVVLPAFGRRNRDPQALLRTLRHELAHIALRDAVAPARVPRWFDEGYARWVAGEWSTGAEWRLRLAFALNRTPPLDSISFAWPARSVEAEVAYLLSVSAVGYLLEQGGEEGLTRFLRRWRDMGSLDAALRATYGRTLGQLEHDWQRSVKARYGWATALSHATVFWAFAALILIAMYGLRRRRTAERREALVEPPDRPAYWLGEEIRPGPDGGTHPEDDAPASRPETPPDR